MSKKKVYRKIELPVIIPLGGVVVDKDPPQVPTYPDTITQATQIIYMEDSDAAARIERDHCSHDHLSGQKRNRKAKNGDTCETFRPKFEKWLREYTNPGGWTRSMSRAQLYVNVHADAPSKGTVNKWCRDLIAEHRKLWARKA